MCACVHDVCVRVYACAGCVHVYACAHDVCMFVSLLVRGMELPCAHVTGRPHEGHRHVCGAGRGDYHWFVLCCCCSLSFDILYLTLRRWGPHVTGLRCTMARVCFDLSCRFLSQSVPHTVAPWRTSSPLGAAWWRWRRTGMEWCVHTRLHAVTHRLRGGKGWVLDERSRVHVEH